MSTLTGLIGSGGGGGATGEVFTVLKSSTFTFPYDGKVKIYCIGGGGGGGRGSTANNRSIGTGGAAGGTAVKVLDVTANDSIICTIGAGGNGSTGNPGSGAAGGQSAVNSNTLTIALTANGGSGGVGANISNGGTFSNVSGAGTGSGGDYNFTGGLGGTISISSWAGANNAYYATGGGATGINQNGISGGNITSSNTQTTFTSGGSVYGTPRNISINSSNSYGYIGRAAPGTGNAPAYSNANDRFLTNSGPSTAASYRAFSGIDTEPGNSAQVASAMRGEGVSGGYDPINSQWVNGGPGAGCAVSNSGNTAPNAGIFGGGGASRGSAPVGSSGGAGGGGGGGATRMFTSTAIPTRSGNGGSGMIIIQYV